jgi:hypothetical protein
MVSPTPLYRSAHCKAPLVPRAFLVSNARDRRDRQAGSVPAPLQTSHRQQLARNSFLKETSMLSYRFVRRARLPIQWYRRHHRSIDLRSPFAHFTRIGLRMVRGQKWRLSHGDEHQTHHFRRASRGSGGAGFGAHRRRRRWRKCLPSFPVRAQPVDERPLGGFPDQPPGLPTLSSRAGRNALRGLTQDWYAVEVLPCTTIQV